MWFALEYKIRLFQAIRLHRKLPSCLQSHGQKEEKLYNLPEINPSIFLDRKSTRLNSSHTVIYTLSLHDALPIFSSHSFTQKAPFMPAEPWSERRKVVQSS